MDENHVAYVIQVFFID